MGVCSAYQICIANALSNEKYNPETAIGALESGNWNTGVGTHTSQPAFSQDILAMVEKYRLEADVRRELAVARENALQIALSLIQMAIYWSLADEMIEKRDEHIDYQWEFIEKLDEYKDTQDLPMLRAKADSLNIPIPGVDNCGGYVRYVEDSMGDGRAIDETSTNLARQGCTGLPDEWGIHEGELLGALAGPYGGQMMAAHSRRRHQDFIHKKYPIVQAGQQGMKAVYRANDILQRYAQATTIYAGLADMFMQGFNSAGASLGTALGQLTSGTGTNGGTGIDASGAMPSGGANVNNASVL